MTVASLANAAGRRNLAVLAALVLTVVLVIGPSASAAGGPQWSSGVPVVLPAGTGTSPSMSVNSVSCRSAGACTAVGTYVDGFGAQQATLFSETSGRWAVGLEASLPANAAANPNVLVSSVSSVSCGSPGNCTAVGSYTDSSGHAQGLLLTETSGAWATGIEAPLPGDAAASPQVTLSSVSCAAPAQCAAVGRYTDSAGGSEGLLLSQTPSGWTASEAGLPGNANSPADASLNGVSCPAAANCTAVGRYTVGFSEHVLLVTENGGTWTAGVETSMPSDFLEDAAAGSVSCPSVGNCTAVGSYSNTSNTPSPSSGLILTETSGTWAPGLEASMPGGASGGGIVSVSCPSVGNCSAVGTYFPGSFQGVLLTETAGVWSTGEEALIPGGSSFAEMGSVSCASPGNCVATGSFLDNDDNGHSVRVTETSGHWVSGVDPGVGAGAVSCPSAGNCATVGSAFMDESAGTWKAAVTPGAPLGTDTSPDMAMNAVSCASAGNCAAVGQYFDASLEQQGLLESETSGTWAAARSLTPPTNAGTSGRSIVLSAVACASAGNCAAAGDYTDRSGHSEGMLLNEVSGSWTAGQELTLPSGAGTDPAVFLTAVSCPSVGNCAAIGSYADSSGNVQGLVVNEVSGKWSAGRKISLPTNAASNPSVQLNAVSCAAPGDCAAVGHYDDGTAFGGGLLVDEAAGTWRAGAEAGPPAGGSGLSLFSVSCGTAGNCAAVGGYDDSSGNLQGGLFSETAGTWGIGVEATLPAGAASNPGVSLNSVSCASAGNCAAVGEYSDSSSVEQGLLLSETSGTWATGIAAAIPGGGAPQFAQLGSTSCVSAGNCVAVGDYNAGSGTRGLLVNESSGSWATGVEATLPAPGTTNPGALLNAVSCAPGGCSAVGQFAAAQFSNGSQLLEGFLVGGSISPPAIASFSPTAGGAGTSIAISGAGFTGATAVTFGGVDAQSFTVDSDTEVTAAVAAGTSTGKVAVTTPGGTATSSGDFEVFGHPAIASFAPPNGSAGTTVAITGSNFAGATAVSFAGTAAESFTVVDDTHISAVVAAGTRTGLVSVTTPGGTATSTRPFTVLAVRAVVYSVAPPQGHEGDGVTIRGLGLSGVTAVSFNGIAAASFTIQSDNAVTAVVPVGATSGHVSVTTPGGTATSTTVFTVLSAVPASPAITSFSPGAGIRGVRVTIRGTGFTGATAVTFNGTHAAFTIPNDTTIVAVVPPGATTGRIAVTTPGGTATSTETFTAS